MIFKKIEDFNFKNRFSELGVVFRNKDEDLKKRINFGKIVVANIIEEHGKYYTYLSENFESILGYKIDDFYTSLKPADLIYQEDIESFEENIHDFLSEKSSKTLFEIRLNTRDKQVKWFSVYVHQNFSLDNSLNIEIYLLDIHEQKMKDQELVDRLSKMRKINLSLKERIQIEVDKNIEKDKILESQKRHSVMGEALEKIAHQWRQPLNIIALIMQDLYFKTNLGEFEMNEDNKDEEHYKEYYRDTINGIYEQVNEQIQYLSTTIDDFRNNIKHTKIVKEYFLLSEVVEEVRTLVNVALTYENIVLEIDKSIENKTVKGVKSNLKQALLNIVNNAKDIIRERKIKNGIVSIKVETTDEHLDLLISDNAGGIESHILEKIFDPYFTTRAETQGTGLGLYMSKDIIGKYFDGELFASNDKKGACFIIRIPNFTVIK
jgi:signal transduction histidine kinase